MSEDELRVPEIARDGRLQGKTVIITGGGSQGSMAGTGAAMSVLFAVKGANVVVLDRDEQRARHTVETIKRLGGEAAVRAADVTDVDQCAGAARFAVERFGSLDVLVSNAAIAPGEQPGDSSLWDQVVDLNLKGAKLMMDSVLPQMRAQGQGSIITISSIAAYEAGGGQAYTAAKAGLVGLVRAVAFHEGRNGIRVNDVAPGHVAIPMGLSYQGWSAENTASEATRLRRARATMLGTEGTGWDVANAVLFFASDESRYVTAVSMPVDGGTTAVFPIVMWPHLANLDD
jgi:NAD(P)-dependent dehydrogenase (short-subunit alcohol dehydrogenase family)